MTGTFISEGIDAAVARATEAAGAKNVGIIGAAIARKCLERGLLGEIIVHLARLCSAMACGCSPLPAAGAFGSSRPR